MSKNLYSYKTINGVKNRLHRHLMEQHLERELESNEHVYHINGDSADNRIENLVLIKKKQHKNVKFSGLPKMDLFGYTL